MFINWMNFLILFALFVFYSYKTLLMIDMFCSEHRYLKMACAKLGITMQELLLRSAFEKIEDMEDEGLARRAGETLKNIKSGKEKLIPWDELKKRM